MSLADPWSCTDNELQRSTASNTDCVLQFEDNFAPSRSDFPSQQTRLPDSEDYLALLERKLKKLKSHPTVLQQLAERREACMQHLLNDTVAQTTFNSNLDEPVNNHELLRFIKPEQALSVAELVNLVKYDHLEQDLLEQDKEGEESGTESSTSR